MPQKGFCPHRLTVLGLCKAEAEGLLLWILSVSKVKGFGFGFVLLKGKKARQGFDPCSTSRAKKAQTLFLQSSARGQ